MSEHTPLLALLGGSILATAVYAFMSGGTAPVTDAPETAAISETAANGDDIRSYILENPGVIREALMLLEQQRALEEARADDQLVASMKEEIFNDGYSFVGGNLEGDLTVVEFQDYRCGYCKRAHEDVQKLVEDDGNIRLIIKEFPILGPDSMKTSQLAIAAMLTEGPDAYYRFSDALMTYGGPINDAALERLAKSANVNLASLQSKLDDPEIERRIMETRALAQKMSINGTPTFVIGTKLVRGYIPLDEMKEMVALVRQDEN